MHAPRGAPPATLNGPFTRADLDKAELDATLLRGSGYRSVFRGVWVHESAIDADTGIRAALALHPSQAIASHFSAARVRRLPVPEHPFEHVTVFKAKHRRFRPGLKAHVTKRPRRIDKVRGIPLTDPVTNFIELAGYLSLVDLVVLGDAIAKRYGIKAHKLLQRCRSSGDYYAARAAEAATLVRDGVDSPMETRLRLLIVLAGLPEPEVNHRVYNEDGSVRRRFDLYYPEGRLIVEYDGRQHADSPRQWHHDIDRREEFDHEGYRILIVVARGVYVEPGRTLQRVRQTLIDRGVAHVPPINDTWREHFPGR